MKKIKINNVVNVQLNSLIESEKELKKENED